MRLSHLDFTFLDLRISDDCLSSSFFFIWYLFFLTKLFWLFQVINITFVVIVPSPSLSKRENASRNSEICRELTVKNIFAKWLKDSQPRAVFATIGREQILKIDFGNILPDFPDAKEISTETKILVHFVSKYYWLLAEKYLFLIIWGNAWCPIWTLIYPSFLKHGLCFLLLYNWRKSKELKSLLT